MNLTKEIGMASALGWLDHDADAQVKTLKAALTLILQGETVNCVTEKTGISRATYFRLKRKIKNDNKNEQLSHVNSK
ncbi:hypothetical protein [Serratia fonticola]|uniref:hypothetical protein n=2 Tax=Serratia fonticola TaxID=47917 RepID=UPI00192CFA4A|nr:hypothetical protein [Serratia fonticola]MBL5827576.1 hypothetical protein [Serratia fonticola]